VIDAIYLDTVAAWSRVYAARDGSFGVRCSDALDDRRAILQSRALSNCENVA
jgi:hypothetical protein